MKQHKWHKEIKAWANGGEVEVWDSDIQEFVFTPEPNWHRPLAEFRIKQQPKESEYLYVYLADEGYHLSRLNPYESKYMKREHVECIGKLRIEPIE